MKMQINEIAKLAGISVRTLHYYDEIDLLKPSFVDEQNGYRFYDEDSLKCLQEILFYRELDFPLKTIAEILSSPNYDRSKAFSEQLHLLTLKKQRLERMINLLENAVKGENIMDLNIFDNSEYDNARQKYAQEAKEKWGSTDAFKESEQKTASYSDEKWNTINSEMDSIINEFSECMKSGTDAYAETAQNLVKKWQNYITDNYYNCTKEILSGLGIMYVNDERFKNNIDKHGNGTAQFMTDAIAAYCK